MFRDQSTTCLGLAAFLLMTTSAFATTTWFVRSWQSDEGLPDNTVMGIDQTPDGFLWVATQTGVVRFDGVQFRNLPIHMPQKGAGIVHALCADRRGRVWVARERGAVVCVDQGRTTLIVPPSSTRADQRVRMLVEDGEGAMWASFIDGSLVRIKDGTLRYFTEADGLPPGGIIELTVDQTGRIWYLRSHGVGVFRDKQLVPLAEITAERICAARTGGVWLCSSTNITRFSEAEGVTRNISIKTGISRAGPTALLEDRSGRLWIGTRIAGLFCYDGNSVDKVDIPQKSIFSIFEDRENNIWVGTRGGGLKQVRQRVAELMTTGDSIGLGGIQSICKDTKGQLWAVTWHKGAVLKRVDQEWFPLSVRDGWHNNDAKNVAADPSGGVWIGTTFDGLYRWQDGVVRDHLSITNGLNGNYITALRTTASNEVWIGGERREGGEVFLQYWNAGALRTFKLPAGCGRIMAIEVDTVGDCWVATVKGVLLRIHGDLVIEETKKLLPQPFPIRALLVTRDNSLWIGFGGMGLGRLKEGQFINCRMEQGLQDDYISQILADGRGRIWLAGNRGICSFQKKNWDEFVQGNCTRIQVVAIKQKDGLPGLQASYDSWPGALRDADGRLHFAMQSGVATFYPEAIQEDLQPPTVIIERVVSNGKVVARYGGGGDLLAETNGDSLLNFGRGRNHLHLPAERRQVEFCFTAPSFMMQESIQFKHRLEGLDREWIDAGTRRSALYSQLAPGNYQFQVKACNRDGVWSKEPATLDMVIAPFWWETLWFRIVGPLVVFGMIGGVVLLWFRRRYQFQIEKLELQRAMEKERARIAADLHDEIGANLTHISILSTLAAKPETQLNTSRQHNAEVTSVARQTILAFDEILWSVNPKNDTLKSLSHYICRRTEEILAPAKIMYHFSLDEALPDSPVSPQRRHGLLLAVKEALHNILKHAGATQVEVTCAVEKEEFVVTVSDNGCGFDPSALPVSVKGRKGQGLENMYRRLKELGGECRIERQPEGGTRITFRLPMD